MKGVTANQLNSIMQLIYFGETTVHQEKIEGVFQLMEEMKLDGQSTENRKEPKTKSILCNFFNRGFCKEGVHCPFNHPKDDCRDHLQGRCQDPCCEKRHRSICKHWLQGRCLLKRDCEFLHCKLRCTRPPQSQSGAILCHLNHHCVVFKSAR